MWFAGPSAYNRATPFWSTSLSDAVVFDHEEEAVAALYRDAGMGYDEPVSFYHLAKKQFPDFKIQIISWYE